MACRQRASVKSGGGERGGWGGGDARSKKLWRKLSAPVTAHCCQGNQTKRRDN